MSYSDKIAERVRPIIEALHGDAELVLDLAVVMGERPTEARKRVLELMDLFNYSDGPSAPEPLTEGKKALAQLTIAAIPFAEVEERRRRPRGRRSLLRLLRDFRCAVERGGIPGELLADIDEVLREE